MSRGDSLMRQWHLIELLQLHPGLQAAEAARELGATVRTLYRDLQVIEHCGVPIYQVHEGKRVRWRVAEGYHHRFAVSLSCTEILSLLVTEKTNEGLAGTLFHDGYRSALAKIRAVLPTEMAQRAAGASQRVSAHGGAAHDYTQRGEMVQCLHNAIEHQETITLTYRKPGNRHSSSRRVDPYHLHIQAGALYLLGWCHQRRAVRTFLLDRAENVSTTRDTFTIQPGFSAAAFLQDSFGPWTGRARKIRLCFGPLAARRVSERKLHRTQVNQWRADGSLGVTMQTAIAPALVSWIVGWGTTVKVIAPRSLATLVAREHARAAAAYHGAPGISGTGLTAISA